MPTSNKPIFSFKLCRECRLSPDLLMRNLKVASDKAKVEKRIIFPENDQAVLHDYFKTGKIKTVNEKKKLLRLALQANRFWGINPVIKVAFMGGDAEVKRRITKHAKVWMDHAGIELKFVSDKRSKPEIRIAFDMTDGSWSYVGTQCLNIKASEPTMNYGWLERHTEDEEYSRTVLHEFGHALGCIHEHSIPDAKIPWNKKLVYAYYAQQGWSEEDVDQQVFDKYRGKLMNGSAVDKNSIMMYAIPPELTDGKYTVGWNNFLSAKDKKLIQKFYPL